MDAIEALDGFEVVEATVWGLADESAPLASVNGTLMRVREPQAGSRMAEVIDEMDNDEAAVCFQVGDGGTLEFWPSRFVSAALLEVGNGVGVITLDGRIDVFSNRPWID